MNELNEEKHESVCTEEETLNPLMTSIQVALTR